MKKNKLFIGKVAWITGASSGIGESLVYEFIRRGATVIASSNDLPGLERVKADCGNKSMMVNCVPFDLADTSGIDKVVEQQLNTFGRIDFLLNVGGISQRARIDETPLWLDRKIFEINYFGTIAFTKAVLPFMVRQRSGHILATSSISGRFGFPLRSAYSASKQALHGFFETLYLENKKFNIKSSVITAGTGIPFFWYNFKVSWTFFAFILQAMIPRSPILTSSLIFTGSLPLYCHISNPPPL